MLYRLPAKAAEENWLCDVLNAIFVKGFADVDAGAKPVAWPDCLPAAHRDALKRRGKLGKAVMSVIMAYSALGPEDRAVVREAREDQLQLAEIFEGGRTANTLQSLPDLIQTPLDEFSERVFEVLDDLGIRSRSYQAHDEDRRLACAFCGYEAADNSLIRNMDWDHYLARSHYPFAGASLRNLTPMGDGCNSAFKRAKDILRTSAGERRRCFDPYGSEPATMDLLASTLFARGLGKQLPEWVVTLHGDADYCETWENVFSVRSRWISKLDIVHRGCLDHFGSVYRGDALTENQVVEKLRRLARPQSWASMAPGGFLPAAIFGLWADRAASDGAEADRLRRLFRRLMQPLNAVA